MSELINNSEIRKSILKELILKLHKGTDEVAVKNELEVSLSQIPYGEVVEVEQELIAEGLPETEIMKLCDIHSGVLKGNIDLTGMKLIPPNHPLDVFIKENKEVNKLIDKAFEIIFLIEKGKVEIIHDSILNLRGIFNNLFDLDKHYQRQEYLLFPFLEQQGITGPTKVMWGKHDEIRDQMKGSIEVLQTTDVDTEEFAALSQIILKPCLTTVKEMIFKEEKILFPMASDKLTDADWYEISKQSIEIGYCLYDPPKDWQPKWVKEQTVNDMQKTTDYIQLPSGSFTPEELLGVLNTLPIDMTFIDKNDKVKYFSQSKDRIFQRNRAILNRDVRLCHPPSSTHIVDKIVDDFKSGRESRAPFWIQMGGKFIHIEYFAIRNEKGEYLGTLEVSSDIAHYRALEGEQRILSYLNNSNENNGGENHGK